MESDVAFRLGNITFHLKKRWPEVTVGNFNHFIIGCWISPACIGRVQTCACPSPLLPSAPLSFKLNSLLHHSTPGALLSLTRQVPTHAVYSFRLGPLKPTTSLALGMSRMMSLGRYWTQRDVTGLVPFLNSLPAHVW